jgi:hypothetical protein
MITPSFALTATERVLPRMALDFTTASLDSRVTFTRSGNTATVTNSSGVIAAINADLPRFDYNPTTLVCNGLLIEEARTNLLLNSLLNGTNLSTQLVTTTAVAHTLSFYGTGQIVLTGTSSATVVGTGVYPNRQTLTFTPTAGALTLTVTGTVQYAQLETGSFATSFIPTAGAAVTRNADVASMTGTNFSSWYNANGGSLTMLFQGVKQQPANFTRLFVLYTDADNYLQDVIFSGGLSSFPEMKTAGVSQLDFMTITVVDDFNMGVVFATNDFKFAANAGGVGTDTTVTIPPLASLYIGCDVSGTAQINGYVKKVAYYLPAFTTPEIQAFTK